MSACPCETLLIPCTHLIALGGVRQQLQPQTIKRSLTDAIEAGNQVLLDAAY